MPGQRPGPRYLERYIATLLLLASFAVMFFLTIIRLDWDTQSRQVEVAFPEARLVDESIYRQDAPAALLQAGVTTLVRKPYSLEDFINFGLANAWHTTVERLEIRLADNELTSSAIVHLAGQYSLSALAVKFRETEFICEVLLPDPLARIEPDRLILKVPAGPMPAGFRRALMLPVGDWGKSRDLNQYQNDLQSLKPDVIMPLWLGGINARFFYQAYFHTPSLRRLATAIPEFHTPLAGKSVLQRQNQRTFIRAHVIRQPDWKNGSSSRMLQRIVRAVRERRINLVYVEPPASWSIAQILEFFSTLKNRLQAAGVTVGPARPMPHRYTGQLAMNILYAGVAALAFLFIWQLALWAVGFTGQDEAVDQVLVIRLKPAYFRWISLGLFLSLMIIHYEGSPAWSGKIAAWLIAIMVPLLNWFYLPEITQPQTPWPAAVLGSVGDFFSIVLKSALAGIGISVLLFQPNFVQGFDQFLGVKAAYLLPILFAVVYFFPAITDFKWWQQRWSAAHWRFTMLALLVLAGLLAVLIIRSGNVVRFPIPDWEFWLRDQLDIWFSVRPRFKEFLLGYPCLLLGLFGRRVFPAERRIWPHLCLVIGSLGPISLINTFCHILAPLPISWMRTFNGLWLGLLLGLAACGLFGYFRLRRNP